MVSQFSQTGTSSPVRGRFAVVNWMSVCLRSFTSCSVLFYLWFQAGVLTLHVYGPVRFIKEGFFYGIYGPLLQARFGEPDGNPYNI